ncbi:MAG TPA: DUF5597 domain-containing protein [Bacteroidales bacterium]|nr:DUF5597 domain-containing protein [Bacteroidales bacterium]
MQLEKLKMNVNFAVKSLSILLLLLITACSNTDSTSNGSGSEALPYIKETNGVKQLIVDGEPYIMIAGELMNSSSSSIEYMEPIWPHLKKLNLNTLLSPISWQQFEPEEGKFDYTLIDYHIKKAYENDMRLVILWFGSWKNTRSDYTPAWVKEDIERFPRMLLKNGDPYRAIANFNDNCLEADKKAYLKLLERIKQVDEHNTVIMMQIENEVGIKRDARDHSPAANEIFEQNVPAELIQHINENLDEIKPILRNAYINNGSKKEGSWEEVFGKSLDTDEWFMAWHYATYINEISRAGKEVYPLPTFVNACAADTIRQPGDWFSGGPNYRMIDIYQCGAPDIDLIAIDNYKLEDFNNKCKQFIHRGNPLFIPETCAPWHRDTYSAPAKSFFTIAHHNAMCFSPFGIDHEMYHEENHPIINAYKVLNSLMPMIASAQVENRVNAFMELNASTSEPFTMGGYKFTPKYTRPKDPAIKGYGLVIQTGEDEFIIAGNAFDLDYESTDEERPYTRIIKKEEGSFVDGEWKGVRVLCGDEFSLKFPAKAFGLIENTVRGEVAVHKVELLRYDV